MTLDLDELERRAKAAREVAPGNELVTAPYDAILALIERVRELDRDRHAVAHEFGCADDAGAYAAQAAMQRTRELEVRIDDLEDVARDVRHLVEDVAKHGRQADAPFTTQERAVKLLAIIDDGAKDA